MVVNSLIVSGVSLLVGLFLLVKFSDIAVESSAKIAKMFGVSDFFIGLTIIAIGTSLPELATSISAALSGNPEIAVGNVVGSNIANIGLILGIAAIFYNIKVSKKIFDKEIMFLFFLSGLILFIALDETISFFEGIAMLILFVFHLSTFFISKKKFEKTFKFDNYLIGLFKWENLITFETYTKIISKGLDYKTYINLIGRLGITFKNGLSQSLLHSKVRRKFFSKAYFSFLNLLHETLDWNLLKHLGLIVVSLTVVVFSADIVIEYAVSIALIFGVNKSIVGLTVIALGTSLPELSTSLSALRKGFFNVVLGNIIGSNITNSLLVLGVISVLGPVPIASQLTMVSIPFMVVITLFLLWFALSERKILRNEGIALILVYLISIIMTILV